MSKTNSIWRMDTMFKELKKMLKFWRFFNWKGIFFSTFQLIIVKHLSHLIRRIAAWNAEGPVREQLPALQRLLAEASDDGILGGFHDNCAVFVQTLPQKQSETEMEDDRNGVWVWRPSGKAWKYGCARAHLHLPSIQI